MLSLETCLSNRAKIELTISEGKVSFDLTFQALVPKFDLRPNVDVVSFCRIGLLSHRAIRTNKERGTNKPVPFRQHSAFRD